MNKEETKKSIDEEINNTEELMKLYEEKIQVLKNDIENMKLRLTHFKNLIKAVLNS